MVTESSAAKCGRSRCLDKGCVLLPIRLYDVSLRTKITQQKSDLLGGISSEIEKKKNEVYYIKFTWKKKIIMVYHKKNVLRKVCKLVLKEKKFLNAYKFSQQKANIIWVGGGGGRGTLWYLGKSVHSNPRTLSFYHSMFSSNFATLTILSNICATKSSKKKAYALWDRSDLA